MQRRQLDRRELQVIAKVRLESRHGTGGRAEDADIERQFLRRRSQQFADFVRIRMDLFLIGAAHDDTAHLREGRNFQRLPVTKLIRCEAEEIVSRRADDRRLFGRRCLDEDSPPLRAAPGAARHLGDQLERSLHRTNVGLMKQRVGVDHTHQRDVWEVESLRDHLRPEQNLNLAVSKLFECHIVTAALAHRVAVHAEARHVGKTCFDFGLQPLGPNPQIEQPRLATFRADLRQRSRPIATVTERDRALLVIGQRDVAVGALHALTAAATPQHRREPAHVEKQNDLPLGLQCVHHRREECPPDGRTLGDGGVVANVHDQNGRQRQSLDALRHRDQHVLLAQHLQIGLERRRGRSQNERHLFEFGASPRDLARVIARRAVLLETRLVFFVDHDQPEMRCRREDRAAGTDDHLHGSAGDLLPVTMPLGVGEMTVQHGDRREATREPPDRLRREADLGNQHDRLSPVADDLFDRANVDLGLAAPRDPVQ